MTQRALRLNEALLAADPVNVKVQNEVAVSAFEVGLAFERLDRSTDALESFRRAEKMSASMVKADPSNVQARWMQALELNLIGANLRTIGRANEGVAAHREALALLQHISQADPANENYHYNIANTYQLIGDAYVAMARSARPAREKSGAWMNARSWYGRSAAEFGGMRRRGTLTGAFVPDADAVNGALALCARELGDVTPGDDGR